MAIRPNGGSGLIDRELDVVVGGDIFVDLVMGGFAAWPAPGTEAFATEFQRDVGGGAAITACGLATLGSRTAALGVVGNDHGSWVAERLSTFGVKTSELRFDPAEPTAFSVAISTREERTFLTYQGANQRFAHLLFETANAGHLARTRHLHLGWAPPLSTAAELLEVIRSNKCSVSLDTGWHEAWLADPRAMELLPLLDVFFPNELEAQRMTGEVDAEACLLRFREAGASNVALKLGAEGAALLWDGSILRLPRFEVTPVDTIGAGDSFDAGFLHFWLQGEDPLTCLRAANFCGAASTEGYGGLSAFPEAARVERAVRGYSCEK